MTDLPNDAEGLRRALAEALEITPEDCATQQSMGMYHLFLRHGRERMEMLLGDRGAMAILSHSLRKAARSYPWLAQQAGGEEDLDLAKLEMVSGPENPEELCFGLEELCITVLQVLIELTGSVIAPPLLDEIVQVLSGRQLGDDDGAASR